MSKSIPINVRGVIRNGPFEGWHIRVEQMPESTEPSFLILYSNPDGLEGYDDAVVGYEDLDAYMARRDNFEIEWEK